MYLCVLCGYERKKKAIISLYSIDWLVFVAETESVYCAARTGSLFLYVFSDFKDISARLGISSVVCRTAG